MMRWRIVGAGAFLSLPLLLLAGFAAWFWCEKVSSLAAQERSRMARVYREVAVGLETNAMAAVVARPKKGWPQAGKIGAVPWGYRTEGSRVRIWRGSGASVRSLLTAPEDTVDFELVLGVFLLLSLSAVLFLSLCGFRFFVRLERDRRDFVAAAAHDLETPVAALGMVLENRAAGLGTDAEAFAECERLAVRLGRLVDNLRDFIHRGRRGAPVPSDFDIVAALREAYRPFAADYRDLLEGDVPVEACAACVRVRADETLTLQILWNLFANDLKYAAPYGSVRVTVACAGGRVRIAFIDGGRGLAARERRRIFERYYRARSTMASGRGGFGIGLCSAREFARAMGGDLTVRDNLPRGCVFTLELPSA